MQYLAHKELVQYNPASAATGPISRYGTHCRFPLSSSGMACSLPPFAAAWMNGQSSSWQQVPKSSSPGCRDQCLRRRGRKEGLVIPNEGVRMNQQLITEPRGPAPGQMGQGLSGFIFFPLS